MELTNKSVLVYDFGLFIEVAVRLAKDFGTVYYFTEWADAFPKMTKALIGSGFEGVIRVDNFEDYIDKVDIIFFPDTHCSHKVEYLRSLGYNVAGVGYNERLELDRVYGREHQHEVGLPTQHTEVIQGLQSLRDYLEDEKDKFVKLNIFRGDIESFYHENIEASTPLLDDLAVELGAKAEEVEFVVEDKIEGIEPGLDSIIFNGETLYPTLLGYEIKGGGYVCKRYNSSNDIPKSIIEVNERFLPKDYSFFFSSEVKMPNKNTAYLIDPCCRMAAPIPNGVETEIIENFSEVVYGLATNEKVLPVMKYSYGGGAAFNSERSDAGKWLYLSFPPEIRKYLKFRLSYVDADGNYYALPKASSPVSVVCVGDSVKEVVSKVQDIAKEVKGYMLDKSSADFVDLLKEVEEGKKYGINF